MSRLQSFGRQLNALVVGANGGLGRAFVTALLDDRHVDRVQAWSRTPSFAEHPKIFPRALDIGDETQLEKAASETGILDLVIITTGFLHHRDAAGLPEKSWRALDAAHLAESFRVNTILPALVAKHALPRLPRKGKAVFCVLSARVGSISDNRLGGWYSYRASKAALNQIIKCIGIELSRSHPDAICLGLHPGTVNTALSQPFQRTLAPDHRVMSPGESAAYLLDIINRASPDQSGAVMAWDGVAVPA